MEERKCYCLPCQTSPWVPINEECAKFSNKMETFTFCYCWLPMKKIIALCSRTIQFNVLCMLTHLTPNQNTQSVQTARKNHLLCLMQRRTQGGRVVREWDRSELQLMTILEFKCKFKSFSRSNLGFNFHLNETNSVHSPSCETNFNNKKVYWVDRGHLAFLPNGGVFFNFLCSS